MPEQQERSKESHQYCPSCEAILATSANILGSLTVSEGVKEKYLDQKRIERAGCTTCKALVRNK